MRTTRRPLVLAALFAVAAAAVGQPPSPHDVDPEDGIGPDRVARVKEWMKALQPAALDPKLLDQIRQLQLQNPHASANDLAKQLLDRNPQLKNRQTLEQLQKAVGGVMPKSTQSTPPSGIPPQPPPDPRPDPGARRLPRPDARPSGDRLPPVEQPGWPPRPAGSGSPRTGELRPDGGPQPADPVFPGDVPNWTPKFDPAATSGSLSADQQARAQRWLGMWEKNFGSLKDNPAVRDILIDLATRQRPEADGTDPSVLGNILDNPSADGMGKAFESAVNRIGWKTPDLGLSKLDLPSLGSSAPGMPQPSAGGGWGGGPSFDLGSGWQTALVLVLLAGAAVLAYRFWPQLLGRGEPTPLPGLGPWPVDPRDVRDRPTLVAAFEYLAQLVCGRESAVWNHVTIGRALERVGPHVADSAEPLADLYAVARYTPAGEPLADADLAAARRHLCRLAGVAEA